jgi:hypothetical protein
MGATFVYSYGRSRHETKKGDRKAAADVLRYARAHPEALGVERLERGHFIVRHPARHLVLRIRAARRKA